MAERERMRERERRIKTERQADGFTLLIIKLHLLTKFSLHIKVGWKIPPPVFTGGNLPVFPGMANKAQVVNTDK